MCKSSKSRDAVNLSSQFRRLLWDARSPNKENSLASFQSFAQILLPAHRKYDDLH
ncbi:MAG: hypothetical protein ACOC35_00625 [Promethearchaeia archaeon]